MTIITIKPQKKPIKSAIKSRKEQSLPITKAWCNSSEKAKSSPNKRIEKIFSSGNVRKTSIDNKKYSPKWRIRS